MAISVRRVKKLSIARVKSRDLQTLRSDSMKINELIKLLQQLDPDKEVRISLRDNYRPKGTREIITVDALIDQDTNKLGFYAIDVNISNELKKNSSLLETKEKKNINKKAKATMPGFFIYINRFLFHGSVDDEPPSPKNP
jgi:myo-inositol-hexaphosphate 3-phosphohydrolase